MFLLIAALAPAADSIAQENQETAEERAYRRLGDTGPVDELDLQLTVPAAENQPPAEAAPPPPPEPDTAQQVWEHLSAAKVAMRAGRIDEPPNDCAWFHYRAALDIEPGNQAAIEGLVAVQQALIQRAKDAAADLDFEASERILSDAVLVRQSTELIDEARREIRTFRRQYADDLETKAVQAMDGGDFAQAERVLIDLIALGGEETLVNQLRRRLEEARVYGGFQPGQVVRDHFINQAFWTPETVIVLAGSFVMGSSAFEEGRKDNEGPQHRVTFRRGFAIGRTEVTVEQFGQFVEKTGYKTDAEKHGYSIVYNHYSGRLTRRDDVNWERNYEGQPARPGDPVVHVSWNDANAFTAWLARGTGKPYRLPSEAEFEYALRGGSQTRFWWGEDSPSKAIENVTGEKDVSKGRRQWSTFFEDYGDGHWGPAPAGSLQANPYGLFDVSGNVGEWVLDCWHDTYIRAPADGTAWLNPGCKLRVIRGGYWASSPDQARSAYRLSAEPDRRDARVGFRIARDL